MEQAQLGRWRYLPAGGTGLEKARAASMVVQCRESIGWPSDLADDKFDICQDTRLAPPREGEMADEETRSGLWRAGASTAVSGPWVTTGIAAVCSICPHGWKTDAAGLPGQAWR